MPEGRFRVVSGEGLITRFESSRGTFRSFCSRCGTSLFSYYNEQSDAFGASAGTIYVPAAVLTVPLDRLPSSHVSFEERVPWLDVADALPRFVGKSDESAT